jgi:hypothetical protein
MYSLIQYIDDSYMELTTCHCSPSKAWGLVTRMGCRILFDIASPPQTVSREIRTDNDMITSKCIFWAVLCSFDIMMELSKKSFKDHSAIANEHTPFLVTNSGVDSLDDLVKRLKIAEVDLQDTKKAETTSQTAATTATNRVDAASTKVLTSSK